MTRPVLTSAEVREDGRLALTYSVRPGRRVTLVAGPEALTEPLAEAILDKIIPLLDQASHPGLPAL